MSRFGVSGQGGRAFFGDRDGTAVTRASVTFAGSATLTATARAGIFGSATFAGSSTLSANGVVDAPPFITLVTPTEPYPGQTGVVIDGVNLTSASFTYNGLPVTVTTPGQNSVTVTWPDFVTTGSNTGINLPYNLAVTTPGGTDQVPVSSSPDPTYLYVRTATNTSGVPGTHDASTFIAGTDFVYGQFLPDDGQWDVTRADQGIFNSIPGLPATATWTFRLWDVTLGEWSNEAVATLSQAADSVSFAGSATLSAAGRTDISVQASVTLAGGSTMTANAREGEQAFVTLAGGSTLSAASRESARASVTFAGGSTFAATSVGNKIGSVTFAGGSTLQALPAQPASVTFAGGSTMSSTARIAVLTPASVTLPGGSSFSAAAVSGAAGGATFNGSSTFTTGPPRITNKRAVTMAGSAQLFAIPRTPGQSIGPIDRPGVITLDTRRGIWSDTSGKGVTGTHG